MYCNIPLATLREKQNLAFDQTIKAIVSACNKNGCSDFSDLNTLGAQVKTEPLAPAAPVEGTLTNT
jgi:hypothetical protein